MLVHDFPETRNSLLVRLKDPADREAWAEFVELYRPLVYRLARRRGLNDADAQDLLQKVLMAVSKSVGRWEHDRERGRFRTWLSRVARNAVIDEFRRKRPDAPQGGTAMLDHLQQLPDATANPSKDEFEREYRREIFRRAARDIRPEFEPDTWLAFWLTTVENRSVEAAANELQKTAGAVYTARSRVMRRLREKVREYEDD